MKKLLPFIACAIFVLVISCGGDSEDTAISDITSNNVAPDTTKTDSTTTPHPELKTIRLTSAQRKIVTSNNNFSLRLMQQVAEEGKSMVISPLSAAFVLGMLANGASDEAFAEIMKTLDMENASKEEMNEYFNLMLRELPAIDATTTMTISNALFGNERRSKGFVESYRNAVESNYFAMIQELDFSSSEALRLINSWVAKSTNNMITMLVDQLSDDNRLLAMNALYFNGKWTKPFDKKETEDMTFNRQQTVSMMHIQQKFDYIEESDFELVRMNYGLGAYNMLLLLPKEESNLQDMLGHLDMQALKEVTSKARKRLCDIRLPRFKSDSELSLNEPLQKLGISRLFEDGGTSGILVPIEEGEKSSISSIGQKAVISLDEEGTEWAAVSWAIETEEANEELPMVTITFDRPFLYLITEQSTGVILLIGQFCGN